MTDNMYKTNPKDDKNSQKNAWMSYQDDDMDLSDDDKPSESGKGKAKKKYSVIPQAVREKFIKRVLSKEVTIKEAAREFGLKFSTSKAILQTYKKEGRIGKKKNRERKTKVVNAVFIANISPNSNFMSSMPLLPLSDIKNLNTTSNTEASSTKQYDQGLNKLSDQKLPKGALANGYNKVTQNIIREFGNDFLRDFIEKNFSQNRLPSLNPVTNTQDPLSAVTNLSNAINMPNLTSTRPFLNFGTTNSTSKANTSAFSISNLGTNSFLMPQKVSSSNSDVPQLGALNPSNLASFGTSKYLNQNKTENFLDQSLRLGQKRSFQNYDKDNEQGPRNEQISDISVKKFKSGEDLWEYDMDSSKKDLEDFLYKAHNAMRNNSIGDKPAMSDFTGYRGELNE